MGINDIELDEYLVLRFAGSKGPFIQINLTLRELITFLHTGHDCCQK